MPAPDPLVALIREWVTRAENDLLSAAHILTLGAASPTETVCFHAQQCEEVRESRSLNRDEFAVVLEQVVAGTAPAGYAFLVICGR